MPSMPHIGINIKKYLYKMDDELDVSQLKAELAKQCSEIMPYLDTNNMALTIQEYKGQPMLLIIIPITIENETSTLIAGLQTSSKDDNVKFSYTFDTSLMK